MIRDTFAEQLAIGLMIANDEAALKGAADLNSEAFSDLNLRVAFTAITNLIVKNKKVTYVSVNDELNNLGKPLSVEDLINIEDKYYDTGKFNSIIDVLIDKRDRRKVISGLQNVKTRIEEESTSVYDIMKDIGQFYVGKSSNKFVGPGQYTDLRKTHDNDKATRRSILTGIAELDDLLTYKLAPGEISILGARPQNGKSAVKANLIKNMGIKGIGVANYALEQTLEVESDRLESIISGVSLTEIANSHKWDPKDPRWEKIFDARSDINKWPYYLIEGTGKNLNQFRTEMRNLANQGVQVVFFDLFDRIKDIGNATAGKPQVVSSALNTMLETAKDLSLHLCLLVQINRESTKRKDIRPMLQDLKDSGAYEEFARTVLLLHYPKAYDFSMVKSNLELHVSKQSNGPLRSLQLNFDEKTLTINGIAKEPGSTISGAQRNDSSLIKSIGKADGNK